MGLKPLRQSFMCHEGEEAAVSPGLFFLIQILMENIFHFGHILYRPLKYPGELKNVQNKLYVTVIFSSYFKLDFCC